MAQAEPKSTNWRSIRNDIFPRWRDQLGSAAAIAAIEALLRHPNTRSAKWRVDDASGEEIPGTRSVLDSWQTVGRLRLIPDADGGADDVDVVYTDLTEIYIDADFPNGHWEHCIRCDDVERWEREHLYFPLTAALPPAPSKERKPAPKKKRRKTKPVELPPIEPPQPAPPLGPKKNTRYAKDDALVAEGVDGLISKKFPNVWQAALALAPRAEGSELAKEGSWPAKVYRLNRKIAEAYNLKTSQNIISKRRKTNEKI